MRSRSLFALAGVAVSVLVSAVAWLVFDQPFLFLFVPFVPFLFWRRGGSQAAATVRRCPICGITTRDPDHEFCPRDGTALVEEDTTDR